MKMTQSKQEGQGESGNTLVKRLVSRDDKYFRKYIESTTAHGVVRIFSGKSVIRKLFWLAVVLGATTGCLYNIIDRISYLASSPTATTLSVTRKPSLVFPAVTVCNLNQFRRDALDGIRLGLPDQIQAAFYSLDEFDVTLCSVSLHNYLVNNPDLEQLSLPELSLRAGSQQEDFITQCFYGGSPCSEDDIVQTFTDSGVCYTFNSGSIRESNSTGTRSGLFISTNIDIQQYVASSTFDAGIKVSIHPQTDVPRPEDAGIGVPPGRNAFISMQQINIVDNTFQDCERETGSLNFQFLTDGNYSVGNCSYDCLLTHIADQCNCAYVPPDSEDSDYADLRMCTLPDLCCVVASSRENPTCNCPNLCNSTSYSLFNSYSAFPARYAADDLNLILGINSSLFDPVENFAAITVFYESLNVETQTTNYAYGPVALLSDIGGQLGLFLGVSVISIMEFMTWVLDEIKHRFFGEKLSERTFCQCCRKRIKDDKETEMPTCSSGGEIENEESDYYKQIEDNAV